MATKRCYGEACAAAHALDLVGERWALLIVRELLLGPKRFTELRTGLQSASPNVLAQRLRELEDHGVVQRRRLGPPAPAWVYELTEWGRDLEPVIIALGRWGSRSPSRLQDGAMSTDSVVLALRAMFDEDAADGLSATFALLLDDDRFLVRIEGGILEVARGEPRGPDAVIETDPRTFAALFTKQETLDAAARDERLRVTGDKRAVRRLFAALRAPEPVPAP